MRRCSVLVLVGVVLLFSNAHAEKGMEEVEKFIQEEIDKTDTAPVKRATIQVIPEVTSYHEKDGKPDKIAVTIMKEYSVESDGRKEYISVHESDGGVRSSMNPPPVQTFQQVTQQMQPSVSPTQPTFKIQRAKDLTFHLDPIVPTHQVLTQPRQAPAVVPTPVPAPQPIVPVPSGHKRKTMDGWIPLHTGAYIGPRTRTLHRELYAKRHFSKGAYYSPHKETLQQSESVTAPQVSSPDVQIQKANLNFFTQMEAGDSKSQKTGPNVSQIKAYGSTPQITALLRERFRQNRVAPLEGQNKLPAGGMSLRSLAQAIRNGAFSLENDVIPSSPSEKPQEVEVAIPHRFKMRKPKVQSGYSNVNTQGQVQATSASFEQPQYGPPTQQQQGGYGGGGGSPPRVSPNAFTPGLRDYGPDVKYALKDHTDSVEIVDTQAVGGYGSSTGSSLNQIAADLEQQLRKIVQQEVIMQTLALKQKQQQQEQYGPPAPPPQSGPQQEYGPPQQQFQPGTPLGEYGAPEGGPQSSPQEEYGPPGGQPGAPLESYGPGPDGDGPGPGAEYGAPSLGGGWNSDHLAPPPKKGKKPFAINLDFDTGFWGTPHANVEIDGGDGDHAPHPLRDYEHEQEGHGWGPDIKEEIKEQLVTVGKNLFHSALDFSRHYNPITFLERVKEFPPIKFEVYDVPKGKGKGKKKGHKKGHGKGHGHGHHGWGKKRRSN